MGSYQQMIVGGMLLVTAFVFGRYVMNHPPDSKPIANTAEPDELKLQAVSSPPLSTAGNDAKTLQQSLRDRILGERAQNSTASKTLTPKPEIESKNESTALATLAEQPIAVPDFSHLEPESPSPTPPIDTQSQRLAAREIAVAEKRTDFENADRSELSPKFGLELSDNSRPDLRVNQSGPARFSIEPKPPADAFTHRGEINIRELEAKLVPVQRKQSQLNLQNREFVDYTTVFGDTLHSLSTKFFGSPEFYLDIYLANRELLRNPSDVPVNTTIRIPVIPTAEKNTPVG